MPIPEQVRVLLATDEGVKQVLAGEGLVDIPEAWLVGSELRLTASKKQQFLLIAGKGPLLGANTMRFWLAGRGRGGSYRILLATIALQLEILDSATNGYRDVRASAAFRDRVSRVVYRYGSGNYRPVVRTAEPMK
ncbi:MAG: hypothetical protein U0Q16_10305 [Bryobacteraceae bacterium]